MCDNESNLTGEFPGATNKTTIPANTGDKPCNITAKCNTVNDAALPPLPKSGGLVSSTELCSAPGKTLSVHDYDNQTRNDTFRLQNAMHRLVWQSVRQQRKAWLADQEAAHRDQLATMSKKARRQWHKDQRSAARDKFKNRVTACTKRVAPDHDEGIAYGTVSYSEEDQRARFGHMIRCDNASCPICGRVKAEKNRAVLDAAIAEAYNQDKAIAFLTFTLRHKLTASLRETDRLLMDAQARMRKSRQWRRFKAKYGWIESVKAWETTYTRENGHHPHRHEIVLLERELTPEAQADFEYELWLMWAKALEDLGGDATRTHGFDAQWGDQAKKRLAEYVNKYGRLPSEENKSKQGLAMEATYSHTKRGNGRKGRTPLQLLDDYDQGDQEAGRLWLEYFDVVKGKQFLIGLKRFCEALGLDKDKLEAEAEAVYHHEQKRFVDVMWLTESEMQFIVRRGLRVELLEHVEAVQGDPLAAAAFIPQLGSDQQPPPLWAEIPMNDLDQAVREYFAPGNSPVDGGNFDEFSNFV